MHSSVKNKYKTQTICSACKDSILACHFDGNHKLFRYASFVSLIVCSDKNNRLTNLQIAHKCIHYNTKHRTLRKKVTNSHLGIWSLVYEKNT